MRGPVPHVVETFVLTEAGKTTELVYSGELGTDLWAPGGSGEQPWRGRGRRPSPRRSRVPGSRPSGGRRAPEYACARGRSASVLHPPRRRASPSRPGAGARSRRRRGAARDQDRRRAGGGHDAHAGARRGARARLLRDGGSRADGRARPDDLAANAVEVEASGFDPERLRRHFYTSSSCGVCGKGAIEAVQVTADRVESPLELRLEVVASLPERLREAQRAFAVTGGLHATGLFAADGAARVRSRGRRPAQRAGQGDRLGVPSKGCSRSPRTSSA